MALYASRIQYGWTKMKVVKYIADPVRLKKGLTFIQEI